MRTIEELQALVDYQNKLIEKININLQKILNKKYLTIDDKDIITSFIKRIAEETGTLEIYKYQILSLKNGKEIL